MKGVRVLYGGIQFWSMKGNMFYPVVYSSGV